VIILEKKGNVFEAPGDPHFAHCIASDLRMGAGIAVDFQKRFGLRGKIQASGVDTASPTCILAGRVFNLITKKRSSGKPTPMSIRLALRAMVKLIPSTKARRIAMPRIGCGLDRQSWAVVRAILREELADLDLIIEVYRL